MSEETTQNESQADSSFAQSAEEQQPGFFREFWDFLRYNKKWWITPIVVVLLLVGALVMMSGTAAAPFIYTLF